MKQINITTKNPFARHQLTLNKLLSKQHSPVLIDTHHLPQCEQTSPFHYHHAQGQGPEVQLCKLQL